VFVSGLMNMVDQNNTRVYVLCINPNPFVLTAINKYMWPLKLAK